MDPSLLVTALTVAPGIAKYLDDNLHDLHGIKELDDYQQRFANSFEISLKNELDQEVNVDGIVSKFESNREEILASLGEEHVVDVTTVVEKVTNRLTNYVLEDLDDETADREEIHSAVKNAYTDTLDDLSNVIPEDDRSRLNNELNRILQKDIEEIEGTLKEIKQTLKADQRQQERHEPFRIERDRDGIDSLIREKISQKLDHERAFQEPPAFGTHHNQPFVLIYGRKGSGKTRALDESVKKLVDDHDFDAVIYLDRGFRELRHLGSLLQLQYNGDVLLIWDDAHDIGDRGIIKDVMVRLHGYLKERGDHDLWVRMTARREELDAVLKPSQHPDSIQSKTYDVDITPENTDLGTFPVDTDEHFDTTTVSKLVDRSLSENGITDPKDLSEEFVAAVINYEPTPAYIESACQTIAERGDTLKEQHIDSLPASTLDSWKKAYAELRHTPQYGEARQAILKSIAILNWINADVFAIPIVREICSEAFGSTKDFRTDLEYLDSRGWVNISDSPARIGMHDIRLEAVDTPTDVPTVINGVSTVLGQMAEDGLEISSDVGDDYASTLNRSFAEQLEDISETKLAEKHFELAARTTEATPDVHRAYAEFLHKQDRPEEARIQRQIAKEMRSNRGPDSLEFRKLQYDIEKQLTSWPTLEEDSTFRNERTRNMLQEDATSTTADWTKEAYSKPDQKNRTPEHPTKRERAKAHAQMEKQQYEEKIEALQGILRSESSESVAPQANLFRTLRQNDLDASDELVSQIRAPDIPAGVITDIIEVRDIQSRGPHVSSEGDSDRVEQSKEQAYSEILREVFVPSDETQGSDSPSYLQTLIEIDTGRNKWLLFMEDKTTTDVINMTVEEAKGLMMEELSSEPIIEQLKAKLNSKYCHVIQAPGAAKDELIIGDETNVQTPSLVETAKVYPQPSPTESAAHPTIATRVMVKELQSATKPLHGIKSHERSGGVLLPTGERADRVCLCGQIMEGQTADKDFWWTKLQDVFGDSITVFTKDYRNHGQNNVSPEHPVIVTGVPTTIETDDETTQVALELRTISNVSLQSCLLTAIEVGEQTLDRIERFDDDPGLSKLSRQQYDIDSAADLEPYKETAKKYTLLI